MTIFEGIYAFVFVLWAWAGVHCEGSMLPVVFIVNGVLSSIMALARFVKKDSGSRVDKLVSLSVSTWSDKEQTFGLRITRDFSDFALDMPA